MNEVDRTLEQLERSRRGGAWHGPALEEVLSGVDAAAAAARPIPDGHTIWELTRHIATWQDVVRRRLAGEEAVPSERDDWPPVDDTSEAAWEAARGALRETRVRLERAVAGLDEGALADPPRPGEETRYALVHGIIQHDLYHAGQIALLAKAADASR